MNNIYPINYHANGACIDGVRIEDIADYFGTPVYVYSFAHLRKVASQIFGAYQKINTDQECIPLYALKVNSNREIIRTIASCGIGADCANLNEVRFALEAGVKPENIWLTEPLISTNSLEIACNLGVKINLGEKDSLLALLNQSSLPEFVSLRFQPDSTLHSVDAKFPLHGSSSKFGICAADYLDCLSMLHRKGIQKIGFHAMLGSRIETIESFSAAYRYLANIVNILEQKSRVTFDTINLGGGIDADYSRTDSVVRPENVIELAHSVFVGRKFTHEFGRAYAASCGVIISKVRRIKKTELGTIVGIDAGMQTLLRPSVYKSEHKLIFADPYDGDFEEYRVVGPICEDTDIISTSATLPAGIKEGDNLVILDAGAYGWAHCSPYNTYPLPLEISVDNGIAKAIPHQIVEITSGCYQKATRRELKASWQSKPKP